jgi:N-ethylmaleimide reductase
LGGSPRKRARFLVEAARAAAEAWSADRVGVRISPFNPFNSMLDSDPVAHYPAMVAELAGLGLAYLHVVEAATEKSRQLTPRLREAFGGPVIVNGGYDRKRAEEALESKADAVSFGASFLANPDLPRRLLTGAPLNRPDRGTFYGGGEKGYLDYPALESSGAPSGEEMLAGR